ncbi:tRNA (adenosine(37)-N6)-threonylcarbamoyltransferase complex dimerization subunit type 1 TsaB [Francisellaceae bacterium CB299]|jgi:tRNA threonylcarbamoyladenosine biosynthesis protein TsaB
MKFLVLDTSTSYCSVALSVDGQIYDDTRHIPRQHNKYLLQMISDLFDKANIDKKSLDFIAYGVGPGSFVGVRLAASVAQGFAVSLDIPIIGFSSMFAIAKSLNYEKLMLFSQAPTTESMESNQAKIVVVLDAKMGDFYLGLYDVASDCIVSENVYKLDEYSPELHKDYYLIGDEIAEINLFPNIVDFKIDVVSVVEFVTDLYNEQKSQNVLTHETYPVYLRGTSHWKTKKEH